MGHKQSKTKNVYEEEYSYDGYESAEHRKERVMQSEQRFHELADEIIPAALALKDHFVEPINDSVIKEFDELQEKFFMIESSVRVLSRNNYPFDEDNQAPAIFFLGGEVLELRSFSNKIMEPSFDPDLMQLRDIASKIKSEKRHRVYQKQRETKDHLYDPFEVVYNSDSASQEELDEAYYSFAKQVYRYLCSYTSNCRSGSYAEAMKWSNEEEEIEAEFKRRFPKYNAPCCLNHAERKK